MKRNELMKEYRDVINNILIDFYKFRNKVGRKNKYNNFTYIKYILRVLFFGELWDTFSCPSCINRSTIKKKFYLWKKNGIFKLAYEQMFSLYAKNKKFKNLFIDSTCIQNINCSNIFVSYYHKIKSKKQIKVSIISTDKNIPLCYDITNPKVHDSNIEPIITKLRKIPNIKFAKNAKLIGDKGYIRKKKNYNIKNVRTTLITPKRKNQKSRNNKKTKKILKKRYVVEQTFSHLKRSYKRLQMVYDRNLENYETFLLMALTCQLIRKM